MTKPNAPLIKICRSCGQTKPLSAFLEISGPQGSTYGDTCSACRSKASIDKNKLPTDISDGSASGTEKTIDPNAKMWGDKERKQQHEDVEIRYAEDRDKAEEQRLEQTDKTTTTADENRKRIETTKSFLDKSSYRDTLIKEATRKSATHQQIITEQVVQTEQVAKAKIKDEINLTAPFEGVAGQEKYKSAEYQRLRTLFGRGAAINHVEQLKFIDKSWGPSSRKK